ncbi:MAG: hypothetical protein LBS84_03185 [Clostridiales bacterium]|nr:hypothetical protein [Clostridiales bacterium]
MANYVAFIRTNYFAVTDEAEFRKIIASVSAEDEVSVFKQPQPDGTVKYGFGLYGSIYGLPDNEDPDGDEDPSMSAFESALQEVLVPGDAILMTEIGYEKLRYLTAFCGIITKDTIQYTDLRDSALTLAKELLSNPDFQTQMEY